MNACPCFVREGSPEGGIESTDTRINEKAGFKLRVKDRKSNECRR